MRIVHKKDSGLMLIDAEHDVMRCLCCDKKWSNAELESMIGSGELTFKKIKKPI